VRRGAILVGFWLLLTGFADAGADRDDGSDATADDQLTSPSTQPPEPGEQYPAGLEEQARENRPQPPRRRARESADWRLTIDASVVADSNVTNSTDRETIDLTLDGTVLPVPLDPSLREHGGIGVGVSAHARGRIPVARGVAVAVDAEGFVLEQEGERSDDASALLAAGVELAGENGATILIQVTGFDRQHAGVSAMQGIGLRARYRQPVGEGQAVSLFVDARFFDSDYGEEFGGSEVGAYLSYEAVLDPTLTGSLGLFARGSWLGADAYSSREFGAYGGLSHYLSGDLLGGISGGISRLEYDGPIPILSPEARRDWRLNGSVYVAARRPVLIGLTPSLTYTYNRTGSSIEYYRADRHRLRFGLSRTF